MNPNKQNFFTQNLFNLFDNSSDQPNRRRLVLLAILGWHFLNVLTTRAQLSDYASAYAATRVEPFHWLEKILIVNYPQFDFLISSLPFFTMICILLAVTKFLPHFFLLITTLLVFNLNALQGRALDGGNNLMTILLVLSNGLLPFKFSSPEGFKTKIQKVRLQISNVFLALAFFQVLLVYATAALCKLDGKKWQEGTALFYILQNMDFSIPWFADLALNHPLPSVLLTYFTVLFQVSFVPLIASRYRGMAVFSGFLFHIGIAVFMGLWHFAFAMISSYALLLDEEQSREMNKGTPSIFPFFWLKHPKDVATDSTLPPATSSKVFAGFDPSCLWCMRFARLCQRFSKPSNLCLDSARDPKNNLLKQVPLQLRLQKLHVTDDSGNLVSGFSAVVAVLERTHLPSFPLKIVAFCGLGDALYEVVAKVLRHSSCSEGACSVQS
jgi:predicted DCC family thiol-disulfide oxidoreductase YuxK